MTILEKANEIIFGDRAKDYGSATENFGRIAKRWEDHLGVSITPEQVVLCMIEVKLSRLANSPNHLDSWIDVAGYVGVKGKLDDGE